MVIDFIGADGCGKSTQLARTREWLEGLGRNVEVVDKWIVLDADTAPECRFIESNLREMQACISEMKGNSRVMFLFWSNMIALEQMNLDEPDTIFLFDGYWQKYVAAEIVYGVSKQWLYESAKLFPKSDHTLWFDASIEITTERKLDNYTPYECGRQPSRTPEGFAAHQRKLRTEFKALSDHHTWQYINAEKDVEAVWEQVQTSISNAIKKAGADV